MSYIYLGDKLKSAKRRSLQFDDKGVPLSSNKNVPSAYIEPIVSEEKVSISHLIYIYFPDVYFWHIKACLINLKRFALIG